MSEVRQAHMPGNYELYDPSANKLGPVICKICWEGSNERNSESLSTVWVSFEGRRMVWWVCSEHRDGLRAERAGSAKLLKSVEGVLLDPGI